jgi:hypothetical protein
MSLLPAGEIEVKSLPLLGGLKTGFRLRAVRGWRRIQQLINFSDSTILIRRKGEGFMPARHHRLSLLATILISVIALTQCLEASTPSGLDFAPAVTYASGGFSPVLVAVADVNGDGKPDLVVLNSDCGTSCKGSVHGVVGVLLGNGDGTFQTAMSYDSGVVDPVSVAVADVNGDGKPDIVMTTVGGAAGSVWVLLGNGDGTFQTAVTYGTGGYLAGGVAVADVNGDGKPDIVVANQCVSVNECSSSNGSAGVLLGNGDGTFQTAVTYGTGGYEAERVAVADVNGDGKPDIVVTNACGATD